MKKLLLLFALFFVQIGVYATPSDKYQLLVKTIDGCMTFLLSQSPEISFTSTDVIITINGSTNIVNKDKLIELIFENIDISTSLQSTTNATLTYRWLSNGDIELTNYECINVISIYNTAGQLITTQIGIGSSIIPFSQMPAGLYLLNINNSQTLKITKP